MAAVFWTFHQCWQGSSKLVAAVISRCYSQPHAENGAIFAWALEMLHACRLYLLCNHSDLAVQILTEATTASFPIGMASVVYNDTPLAPGISQDLILTVDPSKVCSHGLSYFGGLSKSLCRSVGRLPMRF
jgi:hypothetical protein